MYRGKNVLRGSGVVLRRGDIVGEDHPAVVEGWPSLFPISGDEPAPAVEEAVEMEVETEISENGDDEGPYETF